MRVISARHRGQPRPTSRTEALVATRHQRDSWVSRRQQTHLTVVGVCHRWRVWCGTDRTVGVGHGSVVVVVSAQPAAVSTDTVANIDNYCVELTEPYPLGRRLCWEKRFPHFHVSHFLRPRLITSLCLDAVSARMVVRHLLLPAQLPVTHWAMICVIWRLALTVSDVCLAVFRVLARTAQWRCAI